MEKVHGRDQALPGLPRGPIRLPHVLHSQGHPPVLLQAAQVRGRAVGNAALRPGRRGGHQNTPPPGRSPRPGQGGRGARLFQDDPGTTKEGQEHRQEEGQEEEGWRQGRREKWQRQRQGQRIRRQRQEEVQAARRRRGSGGEGAPGPGSPGGGEEARGDPRATRPEEDLGVGPPVRRLDPTGEDAAGAAGAIQNEGRRPGRPPAVLARRRLPREDVLPSLCGDDDLLGGDLLLPPRPDERGPVGGVRRVGGRGGRGRRIDGPAAEGGRGEGRIGGRRGGTRRGGGVGPGLRFGLGAERHGGELSRGVEFRGIPRQCEGRGRRR
mmetsp:Transcript_22024/g.47265  ORF Transcript_22024/g.47265 Transcript_22024/m.47265 type:complete len:323 (-) Transcript_22024:217-1185(-)